MEQISRNHAGCIAQAMVQKLKVQKGTEINFHLLTRKQLPFFLMPPLKTNKQNNSSCTKAYKMLRTYHNILKKKRSQMPDFSVLTLNFN